MQGCKTGETAMLLRYQRLVDIRMPAKAVSDEPENYIEGFRWNAAKKAFDETVMGNDAKLLKLRERTRQKLQRMAKEAAETELEYWLAFLYSDAIVPSGGLRHAWQRICGLLESLGRDSDEHRHQYDQRRKTAPRTVDLEIEELKKEIAREREEKRRRGW